MFGKTASCSVLAAALIAVGCGGSDDGVSEADAVEARARANCEMQTPLPGMSVEDCVAYEMEFYRTTGIE